MPRTVGVAVLCSLPESMPQSSLALLWASPDGESGDKGCGGHPCATPGQRWAILGNHRDGSPRQSR